MKESIFDKVEKEYHAHLDKCKQCEGEPFNLCVEGKKIMDRLVSIPVSVQRKK